MEAIIKESQESGPARAETLDAIKRGDEPYIKPDIRIANWRFDIIVLFIANIPSYLFKN